MPRKTIIEVHGHRGSRGTHPENTIPAFQEAAECGADFLELDLQLSSDDVPMVFHDPLISSKLCRLDGQPPKAPIAIRTLTCAQIQGYDCGSVANKDFPGQKAIPNTFVPSFEDVLRWAKKTPKIGLNIEIKQEAESVDQWPDPGVFAQKTIELLRLHGLLDRARIQSFDFGPLRFAHRMEPGLTMACLFESKADFIEETLRMGAKIVAPDYKLVTEDLLRACHLKGLRVIPWTVNDPKWWEKLIGWGIDGIITDYPRKLRGVLA